jgi:hypothetical protein
MGHVASLCVAVVTQEDGVVRALSAIYVINGGAVICERWLPSSVTKQKEQSNSSFELTRCCFVVYENKSWSLCWKRRLMGKAEGTSNNSWCSFSKGVHSGPKRIMWSNQSCKDCGYSVTTVRPPCNKKKVNERQKRNYADTSGRTSASKRKYRYYICKFVLYLLI